MTADNPHYLEAAGLRALAAELRTPESIYRDSCCQCDAYSEGFRRCLECETVWDHAVPGAIPRAALRQWGSDGQSR